MEEAFRIIFKDELYNERLKGWKNGKNEGRILEYISLKQEDGCSDEQILNV